MFSEGVCWTFSVYSPRPAFRLSPPISVSLEAAAAGSSWSLASSWEALAGDLREGLRRGGVHPKAPSLPGLSRAAVSRFIHQKPWLPFGSPFLYL